MLLNGLDAPEAALVLAPAGEPTVVAVGRLSEEKGFDVLLRAFARVLERAPSARLVIAGDGFRRDALVAEAMALGIAASVDFPGWVDGEALTELLDRASVVVIPSRAEGFGLVALEAALRGRAVVATDVGGLSEVVADGATGLLVPVEDPGALAGAVLGLLEDRGLARRLGEAGRARALREFSGRRHVEATVELYERLADGREGSFDAVLPVSSAP